MTSYLAPGKLILSGEYSVLFGYPAVVLSINKYLKISIENSQRLQIEVYGIRLVGKFNKIANDIYSLSPHTYETLKFFSEEGIDLDNLSIKITSTIPFKGLGSSAALITCLSYALLDFLGYQISKEDLLLKTYRIKKHVEGGSPTDLVASIFGGINLVRYNNEKIYHEQLSKDVFKEKGIKLYAIYSGEKAVTKEIIKNVKINLEKIKYKKKIIESMGRLTNNIWDILKHEDLDGLFRFVRLNHYLLASFGVSTKNIDKIVNSLEETSRGEAVAKISGAGFGDSLIALSKNGRDICEKIEKIECVNVDIDMQGVRKIK